HHLKAQIILTDDIIYLLEGDLLEAMRLIRLRRHAATAIFHNIARDIHDIPYHSTTGREGTGPTTNEHITSHHVTADGDGIVHPIDIGQPAIRRHKGRVHSHVTASVGPLREIRYLG